MWEKEKMLVSFKSGLCGKELTTFRCEILNQWNGVEAFLFHLHGRTF